MNRREFNTRLAALGLAPLAPVPVAATAKTALSGKAAMHYPWAVRYARVHDACSPEKLARAFRLPPDAATEIFVKLQSEGVISVPGLSGVARATNPINWDLQFSPSSAQTTRNALSKRLRKALSENREADHRRPGGQPASEAATETESAHSPEDRSSGSAESPRA